MKQSQYVLVFSLCMSIVLLSSSSIYAISGTPTPTQETEKIASPSGAEEKSVRELREKIALKVEEMKKDNQYAYAGVVTKKTDKGIIISYVSGVDEKLLTVSIDDTLTKIFRIEGTTKKELKVADIQEDSYAIVTGQMLNDVIEADEIDIDEQFVIVAGKISELSKSEFYCKVITYDKEQYTLDVQSSTKQFMVNAKTKEIEKTGFSKLKEGDTIHFVISKTKPGTSKEKNRYDAVRILVIPQELFTQ